LSRIATGSTKRSTSPWYRIPIASRIAAKDAACLTSVGRSSASAKANAASTNAGRKAFSVISIPV
jgi:hypothetical protein